MSDQVTVSCTLPNGQQITKDDFGSYTVVSCWNPDGTCHWYKEFKDKADAQAEFQRFTT